MTPATTLTREPFAGTTVDDLLAQIRPHLLRMVAKPGQEFFAIDLNDAERTQVRVSVRRRG